MPSKLAFTLRRTTLSQTLEMAPKRKQRTKSTGTVTGAVSTKPSSKKEEQATARTLKRAERVETKRVEAEKRKEAVRPRLCHQPETLCHPTVRRDKGISRSRFRETLTSTRVNITRPSRSTRLLSKSRVPALRICQIWLQRGLN